MDDLKEHVIKQFGSPDAQKSYREEALKGLWPSEDVLIAKYFPDGSTVLDLGGGTGRTTIPLHEQGYDVIGVDITPEMIENARSIAEERGLDTDYRVGDATDLSFDDDRFDCVMFSNQGWTQIPGHENRRQALKEIHRVLEPGGVFVFTTHVRQWRGFAWFWLKQWFKLHVLKPLGFPVKEEAFGDRFFEADNSSIQYPGAQYIHIPRVKDVIRMVEDVGFDVLETTRARDLDPVEDHSTNPMFYVCRA